MIPTTPAFRFEGCAIVSADGMLADAAGIQPPGLLIEADQLFFEAKLDAADLVVHGRNSVENKHNSPRRKRITATRRIGSVERDPSNPNGVLWNPQTASFEQAAKLLGVEAGSVAVIGGTAMFDLFLDRYSVFWLSTAPLTRLPGGVPVFSGVPASTPAEILSRHGLVMTDTRLLDPAHEVRLERWVRA
jgi:hypothetical protein